MALDQKDIIKEAAKIAEAIKQVFFKLRGIHGGIRGIFAVAPTVVDEVENASSAWATITGDDKKRMAIEAILLLVPLPRWLPRFVARALISWAIETALSEIKKRKK